MNDIIDLLPENLKKARKLSGKTQAEVAEAIGISRPSYALYETGRNTPPFEALLKIASFLNVPFSDLVGLDEIDGLFRKLSSTGYPIEPKLAQIGFTIHGNEDGYLWLENIDMSFEINEQELGVMDEKTDAYLKYLLHEYIRLNGIKVFKKKR